MAACSSDSPRAGPSTQSTKLESPTTSTPVVAAAAPIPVSADAQLEGTELGNGFTVPAGAVLLGAPTPIGAAYSYKGTDVFDRGWDATMVVPGDPRTVVAALKAQPREAGFDLRPGDSYEGGASEVDGYCRQADRGYVCAARGFRDTGDEADSIDIEFVRRNASAGSPPMSHLWLRFSDSDRPLPALSTSYTTDADLPLGPEPPAVTKDWPPLPQPGEPVLAGPALPDDFPGIDIVEGTRLIGPEGNAEGGGSSGYYAYDLHVAIDEPDQSIATPTDAQDLSETPGQAAAFAYADATRAATGSPESELFWSEPFTTDDGDVVRKVSIDQVGGFKGTAA